MDADAARELNEVLRARREGDPKRADFPARDLSEVLALAADLAGANLERTNLENACLAGAKLTRANLRGANLRGCDLDGADLTEADLTGADLTAARLDDAVLTRALLNGACLEATMGDPLSMTSTAIDKRTIERSQFAMRDIAQLVIRGADVNEKEEASAPSSSTSSTESAPRSSRRNSIVPRLRIREAESRKLRAEEDEEIPASLRSFREMDLLIREARSSDAAPPSVRPKPPGSSRRPEGMILDAPLPPDIPEEALPSAIDTRPAPALQEEKAVPEVGDVYLGATIEKELGGASISKTFLARDAEGTRVVVKVFDPDCEGAELQLPAFQRGLRALNKLQGADDPDIVVAELLAVDTEMTGYVVKYYDNGSIEDLVEVAMTMQGGVEIVRSLARTIHALNENGVLVRSLKPSNVLIDGLTPIISEIDMVDLPTLAEYRGDIHGYGSYVAPEEIVGTGTRSPTADVYALGKLFDFLLTGHEPIAPVGAKPVIADQGGFPEVLVQIISRCIAKDPQDRYQYASEFLEDLASFEKKGKKAALKASIRPGALSRLKAGPSLAPVPPKLAERAAEKARVEAPVGPPPGWVPRRFELGVASLGLLALAAVVAVLLLAPSAVQNLETLTMLTAPLIGFVPWFLPMPRERTRLLRIGVWAATTLLLLFSEPVKVAALRWRHDLENGTELEREKAAENLIRVGERDLAGADLSGLRFSNMDLGGVDFTGANLEGASFSGSFAMGANFDEARLSGARFERADLRGASFEGAKGLSAATCNGLTRLPDSHACRGDRIHGR